MLLVGWDGWGRRWVAGSPLGVENHVAANDVAQLPLSLPREQSTACDRDCVCPDRQTDGQI